MKNIAVLGCGYWGQNLVRNFAKLGVLKTIVDTRLDVLEKFKEEYKVEISANIQDVLFDPQIQGVVIALPAEQHFAIAKLCLQAGKDVFVEKPLALSVIDGMELVEQAKRLGRILMVGHILQYHPAIKKLKELISKGDLGRMQYVYSNRLNFGKIRREENSLWSFAPHDISVILSLIGKLPTEVSARGSNYLHPNIADTTMSLLSFDNGVHAHIYVSWLHPFKEQKLVVVGDRKMVVFDDTLGWGEKLAVYPHDIIWLGDVPEAKKAEVYYVPLEESEPLALECSEFIDCIKTRRQPLTDGEEGLRVLQTLNNLQKSLDKYSQAAAFSSISKNYFAHPSAVIDEAVQIGKGTKIWHFSHILGDVKIGENCSFGQNCVVGPRVIIGNGVKVQNNVSIYEGVECEDDVFLGPSMVFTNVINPRSFIVRRNEFKKTLLKKGCSIGANATIVCGLTIGEYAFIGAGAVVTKDVKPFALIYGNPARQHGWVSKAGNKLEFNQQGIAIDPFDNSSYKLINDQVVMNEN